MPSSDYPLPLLCHPATPAPVVRALEARATLRPDGGLCLAYRLWGDMARLLVPQEQPSQATDLLWEHTCFEAFIAVPGQRDYREFNFSPSGQWASYMFTDYRQRTEGLEPGAAPQITARLFAGRLEVDATIGANSLPVNAGTLQLGLCAVIEAADVVSGSHSYWALKHATARPDFHQRDGFTLELAAS